LRFILSSRSYVPYKLGYWSQHEEAHKGPFTGEGHVGLYEILTTSWHAQLAINLALFGSLSIIVAHHMYAMPPYPYLATDYGTQLSLFTHHVWIGGFCIVGAGAHAAIFWFVITTLQITTTTF
jgi:photosystem I P700 chlorophyll a apoprotein A1